jgi:hypothetical protein
MLSSPIFGVDVCSSGSQNFTSSVLFRYALCLESVTPGLKRRAFCSYRASRPQLRQYSFVGTVSDREAGVFILS